MFLIIAGLWLWVFVPSWYKRSQERQTEKTVVRGIKFEINSLKTSKNVARPITRNAEKFHRLNATKRLFGALIFISIFGALCSAYATSMTPLYWAAFAVCTLVAAFSALAIVAASRQIRVLLTSANRARSAVFSEISQVSREASAMEQSQQNDSRSWQRNPLPAPRQRNGAIEQAVLADVVAIESGESKKKTLSQIELDDILKRRRANG